MRPLMRAAGHEFFTPTYTGLGERDHLARPDIDLSTHIQDVLSVLEFEDLSDVTLLGHSYGGMVATGVADKAADRIARVVYIDAFAPRDGQSLFDLVGPKAEANMRAGAQKDGDGWKLPLNPMPPDTAPDDAAWAVPRRRPQPIRTFEQKITLQSRYVPARHYIYARKNGPGDVFRQFGERARSETGWKYYEIDASHNPHITCPEVLMALLTEIMAAK
jgi:pimeloyl-ACP methyl ester carboxylesterase